MLSLILLFSNGIEFCRIIFKIATKTKSKCLAKVARNKNVDFFIKCL